MEELLLEYQGMRARTSTEYKRYLYHKIDLKSRLIAIKGARGAGKTTLLLQLAKEKLPASTSLYVSMEHPYFYTDGLYSLAKAFDQYDGKYLLLDEVHKYPRWSREIKLIYDSFPGLHVLFTSSSLLELYKAEADLSRRLVSYNLKELSFREYLYFDKKIDLPAHSLDQLFGNHRPIAQSVVEEVRPLPLFKEYLRQGAYPYFQEDQDFYLQKLRRTINLTIELDIPAVEGMTYDTLVNLKKLLSTIATSVPFTPNISKLSTHIGLSRNHLVRALQVLERAGLLIALYHDSTGIGRLTKPEKLFLNNSNLLYALASDHVSMGHLRETFVVNQLQGLYPVHLSKQVDFIIDRNYAIEVGGKNKKKRQLAGLNNAFVVRDDIEIGVGNVVPLWLLGFLY